MRIFEKATGHFMIVQEGKYFYILREYIRFGKFRYKYLQQYYIKHDLGTEHIDTEYFSNLDEKFWYKHKLRTLSFEKYETAKEHLDKIIEFYNGDIKKIIYATWTRN